MNKGLWIENNTLMREGVNRAQRELYKLASEQLKNDYEYEKQYEGDIKMEAGDWQETLEEYTNEYKENILDFFYGLWNDSDILIPYSFARNMGEDPYNVSQDVVERYFDDCIWTPEFRKKAEDLVDSFLDKIKKIAGI